MENRSSIIVYQRQVCRNLVPNLLKKRNLTAIPLILITKYGQPGNLRLNSNAKELRQMLQENPNKACVRSML